MKYRLSLIITLSGWFLLISYILYDYNNYGDNIFRHLFYPDHSYDIFFHIMIAFIPVISTALGYLVNKSTTKLIKDVDLLKEKYYELYQNAPDGYISISEDKTIMDVNDRWLEMLEYEESEVIGEKLPEFLADESIETFEKVYSNLNENGYIKDLELYFKKKSETLLPVSMNLKAVYNENNKFAGSNVIIRDNSERKQYEAKLINASREWKETFDGMPYGVLMVDKSFNIIRANKYISDKFGIPIKELINKKCYSIIHKSDKPIKNCPLYKAILKGAEEQIELYDPSSNSYFSIKLASITDENGNPRLFVHSIIDITNIKEKEKKIIESRDAFFNMLKDVDHAYKNLKELYNGLILAFVNAIDAKSKWTGGHSERVANYAVAIAKEMGMKELDRDLLKTAALLHDIGKVGTYDKVLDKPGKLTEEEWEMVKQHPVKGEEILRPITQLKEILPIIRHHHERVDGKGYPDGLKGEEIPLMARILGVADSYDSMTADRPYRPAPGKEFAINEFKRCAGTQFDSKVVEAFLKIIENL
jgi:PAS domain S-box-containing protein/putative nucleotidyltransferase with HDIG domain